MFGDRDVNMMDNLSINVEIDASGGNVPMVYNCSCTPEEIKRRKREYRKRACSRTPPKKDMSKNRQGIWKCVRKKIVILVVPTDRLHIAMKQAGGLDTRALLYPHFSSPPW